MRHVARTVLLRHGEDTTSIASICGVCARWSRAWQRLVRKEQCGTDPVRHVTRFNWSSSANDSIQQPIAATGAVRIWPCLVLRLHTSPHFGSQRYVGPNVCLPFAARKTPRVAFLLRVNPSGPFFCYKKILVRPQEPLCSPYVVFKALWLWVP